MLTRVNNQKAAQLVSVALVIVTLIVTPSFSLDPINAPKLWAISTLAGGCLALLFSSKNLILHKENRVYLIPAVVFLFTMLAALLVSPVPKLQQIFGDYGRNTGFLTYFCFTILFLVSALLLDSISKKPLLIGISIAFGINVIYSFIQATGNDPQKWTNPYTPVIGTLGNPNFAGAFLGIGCAFAFAYIFDKKTKFALKIVLFFYLSLAAFAIHKSLAEQGWVLFAFTFGLVLVFVISRVYGAVIFSKILLGFGVVAGAGGVFGTLNKGPLASYLYGATVTYRGDYWRAGYEMFKYHPWFGIGLDSYGDFYRGVRTLEATLRRGPSIVTNASHNVFIDLAATAGIFTLLAYLVLVYLGFKASWSLFKSNKNYEPFAVSVFVAWCAYLLQSIISINNIALGIWGWVLPGILISMNRWVNKKSENISNRKIVHDFSGMAVTAGLIIGAAIGYFPFSVDANFRHALESSDAKAIRVAAEKWPKTTNRLNTATLVMHQNKISDLEISLARESVKFNPYSYDAWFNLYSAEQISANEKKQILKKLLTLDPHNPDLKKLG